MTFFFDPILSFLQFLCPLRGEIRRLYFNREEMKIKLKYGESLLHHIAEVYESTSKLEPETIREILNSIEFLVRKGVDINARNFFRRTPLVECIKLGYEVIEKLLMLGANPNIDDIDGMNALHRVVDYENEINENEVLEVVRLLLRAGINCEAKGWRGQTPLMYFVNHSRNSKVVEELLDHGANPNALDSDSKSSLYKAYHRYYHDIIGEDMTCEKKDVLDIIILLLLYGADPSCIYNEISYLIDLDSLDLLKLSVVDQHLHNKMKDELENRQRQIELCKIDEYVKELNELKLYNLTEDISLYTLCTTRDRQELGSIYKTVSSLPNMSRIVEDIKQFKHYSRLLETRLRIGEKVFLKECFFFYSGEVVLICDCMDIIFSYLDEEDMRKLMFVSRQQRECRVGAL